MSNARASNSDVFLSYKREDRPVAQELAEFLTTRGFNVWWDAALLAGENFATVVQDEVRRAKAVVALWSRLSVQSEWVKAEAAIALEKGTLINTVIGDLPFAEIPAAFAQIHAARLGNDRAAFFEEIAEALALKGVTASEQSRTADEAQSALEHKVSEAEFFLVISSSRDRRDFEEYLDRFGTKGQFGSVAQRRIEHLDREAEAAKTWWRRAAPVWAKVAAVVALVSGLTTIAAFFLSVAGDPNPAVIRPADAPSAVPRAEAGTESSDTVITAPTAYSEQDAAAAPIGLGGSLDRVGEDTGLAAAPSATVPESESGSQHTASADTADVRTIPDPQRNGAVPAAQASGLTDPPSPGEQAARTEGPLGIELPPNPDADVVVRNYNKAATLPTALGQGWLATETPFPPFGKSGSSAKSGAVKWHEKSITNGTILIARATLPDRKITVHFSTSEVQPLVITVELEYDDYDMERRQLLRGVSAREISESFPYALTGDIENRGSDKFVFVADLQASSHTLDVLTRSKWFAVELIERRHGAVTLENLEISDAASERLKEMVVLARIRANAAPAKQIAESPSSAEPLTRQTGPEGGLEIELPPNQHVVYHQMGTLGELPTEMDHRWFFSETIVPPLGKRNAHYPKAFAVAWYDKISPKGPVLMARATPGQYTVEITFTPALDPQDRPTIAAHIRYEFEEDNIEWRRFVRGVGIRESSESYFFNLLGEVTRQSNEEFTFLLSPDIDEHMFSLLGKAKWLSIYFNGAAGWVGLEHLEINNGASWRLQQLIRSVYPSAKK